MPNADHVAEATENLGARRTVEIKGSFGVLNYALLAFTVSGHTTKADKPEKQLIADLLARGFRPACNGDYAEIAVKAQYADGSIQCRASTNGLISLVFDNEMVWSQQFDPKDQETASWLEAAQARDVTLISGNHIQISDNEIDLTLAAVMGTLVIARIPAVWT
ncbi:MAG: hypothetical protein JWQ75_2605 [Pseudarthrobacter sp.]|nr:hypothetical protein [Pseudarthrobacter sp.]